MQFIGYLSFIKMYASIIAQGNAGVKRTEDRNNKSFLKKCDPVTVMFIFLWYTMTRKRKKG